MVLGIAVFDLDVLPIDETSLLKTFAERENKKFSNGANEVLRRNPRTGSAVCCARAASGKEIVAPPARISTPAVQF